MGAELQRYAVAIDKGRNITMNNNPVKAACWMLLAGLSFAMVNTLSQYLSMNLSVPSTVVAFVQYGVALVVMLPWLLKSGMRKALHTKNFKWHILRVALAIAGIQVWLWALAYPVPIWQGISLLMLSPLFATIGAALFLGENVGWARFGATLVGFLGALVVLAPWTEDFSWGALLPVVAAFFWAAYSLMVKRLSADDSTMTMVVYLLLFITPFNVFLVVPDWDASYLVEYGGWLALSGVLVALAQWSVASAYANADASFVQPFDHAKLPINILAGWIVFAWVPPGYLWLGAFMILASVVFIGRYERT